PERGRARQAGRNRRHGAPPRAALQDDAAVLDAHAGQLRPEGGHSSPARGEARQEGIGDHAISLVVRQYSIVVWGSVPGTLPFSCPFVATKSGKRQQGATQSEGRKSPASMR